MSLLIPQYGLFLPAVLAILVYVIRFLAFATIAFFTLDPSRNPGVGYTPIARPAIFNLRSNIHRELLQSLRTLIIFSAVIAVLFGYGLLQSSRLYYQINNYPQWWFWASIPVMIFLHDTLFYWLHRVLHVRPLYELFHRPHHDSLYTTAFTSYSFGWGEALFEAMIVTVILFIVPAHPMAFIAFQTISTAFNIYGHCGRDFFPESMSRHWLGRWLNTSSLHAHHHRFARGNYSFYFTVWDRLMHTLVANGK